MTLTSRAVVNGAHLAYTQHGEGEPVLLLHPGFVADGMLPLLTEPALQQYRLIAYHRRGYGDSDQAVGQVTMHEQVADAVGVLDELGVDRAHLVGHSMGAAVAIEMALTVPRRVATLTLMEPLLGFVLEPDTAAFVAETAQVAMPRFLAGDRAGALDAWLTGAFGPGFRAVLERNLPGSWEQAIKDADTAFGVEAPALQGWPVGPADLSRIDSPALSLVHAEDSWAGFQQTHEALQTQIPGCEAAIVNVSSHLLQIADPSAIAAPVAAFLAGSRPRGS